MCSYIYITSSGPKHLVINPEITKDFNEMKGKLIKLILLRGFPHLCPSKNPFTLSILGGQIQASQLLMLEGKSPKSQTAPLISPKCHPASKTEFDIKPKTQKLRHPKPMKTTWPLWVSLTQKFFQNGLWDWKFMEMLTSMRSNFTPKKTHQRRKKTRWANKGKGGFENYLGSFSKWPECLQVLWPFCEVIPVSSHMFSRETLCPWSLMTSNRWIRQCSWAVFFQGEKATSQCFGHPQLRYCFFCGFAFFFRKRWRHWGMKAMKLHAMESTHAFSLLGCPLWKLGSMVRINGL